MTEEMNADELTQWLTAPGPYAVRAADVDPDGAAAAGRRAGWRVAELATPEGTDKQELLARCRQAFGLPDWFGANWDALADSLRDVRPGEGHAGVLVVWDGSHGIPERDREVMVGILTERCALRPDFAVVLVGANIQRL